MPGKLDTTGLFRHNLFPSLLYKAKTTANMGPLIGQQGESSDLPDPIALLFTEPIMEKEAIPSPQLFVDIIQRQWTQPGSIATPSHME